MRRLGSLRAPAAWGLLVLFAAPAQEVEPLTVYTDPPRLLLRAQRLRLLRRERERQSMRWMHFQTLMAGGAVMAEPGFAWALYYQISNDAAAGKRAVEWALGPANDLRQLALVFDWCRDVLTPAQTAALAGKLARGIALTEAHQRVGAMRSRALAAIALADRQDALAAKVLDQIVNRWWRGVAVPAIRSGRDPLPKEGMYAFFEMLHAIRDNTNADLREDVPKYFEALPASLILGYYPASFPAPENEYRIPSARGGGAPDVRQAALARAAELSMVAFDTNAPANQSLQGWLMHDNFILRSTFGAPYEFLWANPYQPGLSYYHLPLVFHDERLGRLFVRSSWEESATWLGYFNGELQMFQDGRPTVLNPQLTQGPISLTSAIVFFGSNARQFETLLQDEERVFILGLKPKGKYDLEVDDQELVERTTDPGGILPLTLPQNVKVGVRLQERPPTGIQSQP
jgi:hypothetical protein